jgi:hypothetical protein
MMAPPLEDPTAEWRRLPPSEHIKAGEALLERSREHRTEVTHLLNAKYEGEPHTVSITRQEWIAITDRLALINQNQPEYRRAQGLIRAAAVEEHKVEAAETALEEKRGASKRKQFAEDLEETVLQRRMNTDVSAFGAQQHDASHHVGVYEQSDRQRSVKLRCHRAGESCWVQEGDHDGWL